jgi:hypothetical protein
VVIEPVMAQAAPSTAESFKRGARVRTIASVRSLESLVGTHPDALRDIYGAGAPADPTTFSGLLRGRLLAVEAFSLSEIFLLARPAVRLGSQLLPWDGKRFESGGTSGCDVFLGRDALRFRCELGDSKLDGEPTLVMTFDGLGNPSMFDNTLDELRKVGDRVLIGPGSQSGRKVDVWFGLELP